MGIYDRDYMADNKRGTALCPWSTVTWLLIVNCGAFAIHQLFFDGNYAGKFDLTRSSLFEGEWLRLFGFQFFHADLVHFLINMAFLFFAGRAFEQLLGGKWVLLVYLVGGVVGGLAHVFWSSIGIIGASASILAIFTALVFTIPEQTLGLFLQPINLKLKFVGWLVFGGALIGLFFPFFGISFVSHLGGMLAGCLLICFNLLFQDRSKVLNSKGEERRISKIAEAAEIEIKKKRQKETIYLHKKVDAILEKISKEGMQSLTPEERKILNRTSEKLSRKPDDK